MGRNGPGAALAAMVLVLAGAGAAGEETDAFRAERELLVRQIESHAEMVRAATGIPVPSPRVLAAIARVPRHAFVPEPFRPLAYVDRPLPVGHGQNTAQPYIVALMTDLARVGPDDIVFETGTGAGYHAAVLSLLAKRVYSAEVIEPLARAAAATLARLGYDNVEVAARDGYYGWPERAPFDVIIIKEAVDHVPPPLLRQLKAGGRMVLPLGPTHGVQRLTVVEKDAAGRVREKGLLPVRFSPFQGGERI